MRIEITRNRKFRMNITVKEPGSLTPLPMDPQNDTVAMHFKEKGPEGKLLLSKDMSPVQDPPGVFPDGEWFLILTEAETALFPYKEGYAEDGYMYKAPVRAQISIDSVVASIAFADIRIDDVYISDIGLPENI